MTLIKKAILVSLFVVTPVFTSIAIYLDEKYHLQPYQSLFISLLPGFFLVLYAGFRFYRNFYFDVIDEVQCLTGLKQVFKPSSRVSGMTFLKGTYKCAEWEIVGSHRHSSRAITSDDRLIFFVRFFDKPDKEQISRQLKSSGCFSIEWTNDVNLKFSFYIADVESAVQIVTIMDKVCDK